MAATLFGDAIARGQSQPRTFAFRLRRVERFEEMGLHLGMDLVKFGITRDNVKDIIQEYITEKSGIPL